MANLTDLQTATADLTTAATAIETAITNFKAAHAGDITPTDADTIKTAIEGAVASLNNAATTLTT